MPASSTYQLVFAGGMNPRAAPHLVAPDEVASATNIDFGFERGAAAVRQGSVVISTVGAGPINRLFKHYSNTLGNSTLYAFSGGVLYRSSTAVMTSGFTEQLAITQYKDSLYSVAVAGSLSYKIPSGSSTAIDWIKSSPASAPTVVVDTLGPLVFGTTFFAGDGTMVNAGPFGTDTATFTVIEAPFRIQINFIPLSTNISTNGGNTISDAATDSTEIWFSNPALVANVSKDYSIDSGDYINYWHSEMNTEIGDYQDMLPDVEALIDAQLADGTGTATTIDLATRDEMLAAARFFARSPVTRVSAAKQSYNSWNVSRANFNLVSKSSTPTGWTNIGQGRIIVQCNGPQEVRVRNWNILGASGYPLNDAEVGLAYQETFAEIDSAGTILGESAPGDPSARTKMQNSRAIVTGAAAPSSGTSGSTHRILYRQGGFLRDFYAVATNTIGTATYTDTTNDITALAGGQQLTHDVIPRASFPNNIVALSEPHYARIFAAHENFIRWSNPNLPDVFSSFSRSQVSHSGDEIKSLVVWPPGMVIINRDSVYELDGTIFESPDANWVLRRTGSRHGSKAHKTVLKTPYGIPLLDLDGLYMYIPGQGVDQELTWFMERFGDTFRGTASTDPAAVKGSRVPAINRGYIHIACAEYYNGRYYLAVPTGSSTTPNTVFVIDFANKQSWVYTYPYSINALCWDFADARLLAGGTNGTIRQLETGDDDSGSGIAYRILSRAWSAPTDTVLENISLEFRSSSAVVSGIIEGTSTTALGTITSGTKSWTTFPMSAAVAQSFQVNIAGTAASGTPNTFYQVQFDALTEPKRIRFYKTDYQSVGEGEAQWDYHNADMETFGTGSVLGTCYIDGTAVMTHTITTPSAGRQRYLRSFAPDTFGRIAHTIYNASTGVTFKLWTDLSESVGRPEPPRVSSWKTDIESLDERICDAYDVDVMANGTVTGIAWVDNTSVATGTFVGTARESYTWTFPNELYGRTIFVTYTGSAFKHYATRFHTRPEPDRWTNYISERRSGNEKEYKTFECDINPLGNTVVATAYVDSVAMETYTFTGTTRQSHVRALPNESFGRTVWAAYNISAGPASENEYLRTSGRFKFYRDWFEGIDEPDRVLRWKHGPVPFPSEQYVRTWVAELNPLGTMTGSLLVDNTAISTRTFTGSDRQFFNTGLDVSASIAIQTGSFIEVFYSGSSVFKHYNTAVETEPKPFGKTTWSLSYKKSGGASQLDLARFWSYDIEVAGTGTSTLTSIWDVDGTAVSTNTFTCSGRAWRDVIPFPPGIRGYLFQQRILASTPVRVYRTNLDTQIEGVKGFSRKTYVGTPTANAPGAPGPPYGQ